MRKGKKLIPHHSGEIVLRRRGPRARHPIFNIFDFDTVDNLAFWRSEHKDVGGSEDGKNPEIKFRTEKLGKNWQKNQTYEINFI